MTVEQAIERARMMSTAFYGAANNLVHDFPEAACHQSLNAQAIELLATIALQMKQREAAQ